MPRSSRPPFLTRSLPARLAEEDGARPLRLRGVRLNWVDVRERYHYPPHRHPQYELIVPLRGVYRGALNGERLAVAPGRLLFVQEGDRHEDFYRPGGAFAAFLFTLHDGGGAPWASGVFAPGTPAAARDLPLPRGSRLAALASLVLAEGKARRHSSLALESLVESFFWLLAEGLPEAALSAPFRHALRESAFRRLLLGAFAAAAKAGERPRVGEIARRLEMSERSLDAKCRAALGTSPARAFAAHRMREAARLLGAGMRVREAAEALGFADPFHFSKAFRRHLGCAPSRFAKGKGPGG